MGHLTDGTLLGEYELSYKMMGGGGFVTTGNMSQDGFQIAYSDVCGPVFRRPGETEWTVFFRAGVSYTGDLTGMSGDVGGGTRVADTDSNVIGSLINGYLFRCTTGPDTIERTTFPKLTYDGVEGYTFGKGTNFRIDPQNASVWWLGTPEGMYISTDMFDTWALVSTSSLPIPSSGSWDNKIHGICFDQYSALTSGKTSRAAVCIPGHGVYKTTNAGSTWSLISGSPTDLCHMEWDSNGNLHAVAVGGDGAYHRWDGSSWMNTSGLTGLARPVVDPLTPGRVLLVGPASNFLTSNNYGVTWRGGTGGLDVIQPRVARNIPWQEFTNEYYLSHGDMHFDPIIPNKLWLYEGIGVWYALDVTDPQDVDHPVTWYEDSVGIENLTSGVLMISPLGALGYTCWDRAGLALPKRDIGSFPRTCGPDATDDGSLAAARDGNSGMDWAFDDPTHLVMTSRLLGNEQGGYSIDEGRHWQGFTARLYDDTGGTGLGCGNIIALSKQVLIWHQYGSGGLWYTLDGAATPWQPMSSFFGANFDVGNAYTTNNLFRKILVKDAYHQNVAYYYCIANNSAVAEATPPPGETPEEEAARLLRIAQDNASRGVWKIIYNDDGTFTCTRQRTSLIGIWGVDYYSGKLVQYGDGHWLWVQGDSGTALFESLDDCVTWSTVNGTDDINGDFGGTAGFFIAPSAAAVGRGALPSDPKTVMVIGHRPPTESLPTSHTYHGMWLCRNFTDPDASRTWERIAQFPGNQLGYWGAMADSVACPIDYANFYVAGPRSGVFQYRFVDRRTR